MKEGRSEIRVHRLDVSGRRAFWDGCQPEPQVLDVVHGDGLVLAGEANMRATSWQLETCLTSIMPFFSLFFFLLLFCFPVT